MGDAEIDNSFTGHASGSVLPFEQAIRSLPTPLLIIETGTGRIVFANDAAVAAGLSRLEFESNVSHPRHKSDGTSSDGASSDGASSDGASSDGASDGASADGALSDGGSSDGASPATGRARLVPENSPLARAVCGDTFDAERLVWNRPGGARTFIVCARRLPNADRPLAAVTFIDVSTQVADEAELRRTLRAREEFVSVATHELKEPLNSMLLALQLLRVTARKRKEVPPADWTEDLDLIERQGLRLARQVANLLDASRIDHGKFRLELETLDLCELVRGVVESFRPDALAAGGPLTLESDGPVVGSFDPVRMEQVVTNLVANAIKYGGGGPVRVRVGGDASRAVLDVEDQGIGVPAQDHRRVFEPFERAASIHRRNSLGLGLHIVRTFVEAHGGTVRLRSEVGKGSTFTVELPLHPPGVDGDGDGQVPKTDGRAGDASGDGQSQS